MIHYAPATMEDAFELDLREEDAKEVTPGWRERMADVAAKHPTFAFRDQDGSLVALGGVQNHPGISTPWLLCSPLVGAHKATAFRLARRAVREMQASATETVGNFIPKDSHANRRFVTALGFSILESPSGFDFFFLPHV